MGDGVVPPKNDEMKEEPEKGKWTPAALRQQLHDGLCQNLTASLFFAETLRMRLQKSGQHDDSLLNLADRVVEANSQAATEMRAVLSKLAKDQSTEGRGTVPRPDE